jgi:hypothetical protein
VKPFRQTFERRGTSLVSIPWRLEALELSAEAEPRDVFDTETVLRGMPSIVLGRSALGDALAFHACASMGKPGDLDEITRPTKAALAARTAIESLLTDKLIAAVPVDAERQGDVSFRWEEAFVYDKDGKERPLPIALCTAHLDVWVRC